MMMEMIRDDLAALNVRHDVFFSERSLQQGDGGQVDDAIDGLARDAASSMRAACRRPRAQPLEDWEDREQTLFRATEFGDDVDRPLMKSDGSYTYFASDIAYHTTSSTAASASMIDVLGRRPRRLCQAHAGGRGGAVTAAGPSSTSSSASW